MTNPKIEKVKANIAKTKAIIADYQAKLKEQERQKIQLENDEIVAMYRREKLNEDEFKELLRKGRNDNENPAPEIPQTAPAKAIERKEENPSDSA
jgi:hypothetical protein